MEILKDTVSPLRGEFTLTEVRDGVSTVLVHDNNLIVNRAKESLAEMLSGLKNGELSDVYDIQPINRFELGSGSHTALTANPPSSEMNALRARLNQAGGLGSNNATNQLWRIDFKPSEESDVTNGGAGSTASPAFIDNLKEYDNRHLYGDNAYGNTTPIMNVTTLDTDVQLSIEYGISTDTNSVQDTSASTTYKNSITYEITIPAGKANQDAIAGARTSSVFDTENPVYYSEAGLFIRKGDLDTTFSNHSAFAIKTFPPRPKATDSKWVVKWTIIF